jgi:hypothetical protein
MIPASTMAAGTPCRIRGTVIAPGTYPSCNG